MHTNKSILITTLLSYILLSACSSIASESGYPYSVNLSKSNKEYYHLLYNLNETNLVSIDNLTEEEFIRSGGQFEVIIKKSSFPIPAPNCKSNIILRMPWSEEKETLREKYNLYKNIELTKTNKSSLSVSIELNPYITKINAKISLTNCNVFFRTANSRYIPHVNIIK